MYHPPQTPSACVSPLLKPSAIDLMSSQRKAAAAEWQGLTSSDIQTHTVFLLHRYSPKCVALPTASQSLEINLINCEIKASEGREEGEEGRKERERRKEAGKGGGKRKGGTGWAWSCSPIVLAPQDAEAEGLEAKNWRPAWQHHETKPAQSLFNRIHRYKWFLIFLRQGLAR